MVSTATLVKIAQAMAAQDAYLTVSCAGRTRLLFNTLRTANGVELQLENSEGQIEWVTVTRAQLTDCTWTIVEGF